MKPDRLEGLRAAVELSPDNHPLRLVLAESLRELGLDEESLGHYERLLDAGALPAEELVAAGTLAAAAGRLHVAARCLDAARRSGVMGGTAQLEDLVNDLLAESGALRPEVDDDDVHDDDDVVPPPRVTGAIDLVRESAAFSDVGGLDEVKKAIHRTIILPYQRPDLYERYGRKAGGGVLLYGPPGCGKTLLARATAGECNAPFLNLRIEDVLDPMYGVTERRLHAGFEEARTSTPCVLFLDELDAFAYARRKQQGGAGRALVDQLLQELDAIGSDNRGLLVLAATNAPWDVDDALKRPGRFDRVVFVPPPDPEARLRILSLALAGRPVGDLDLVAVVERTPLFSGADLHALVERAVDAVIDAALDAGDDDVPISQRHLEAALAGARATTAEWLRTARNYVEFANDAGRYDEVQAYLERRDVRKHVKRAA
jgi:transitional endoplasmic reticulum ATPase